MHVGPCCTVCVRAYTGVPAAQGTWKTAGVGRGRQRGGETVLVHCAVTTHTTSTAATNPCSAAQRLTLCFMYCRIVNNLYFLSMLGKDLNPLKYRLMSKVIGFLFIKERVYTLIRKRMSVLVLGKYDRQSYK